MKIEILLFIWIKEYYKTSVRKKFKGIKKIIFILSSILDYFKYCKKNKGKHIL